MRISDWSSDVCSSDLASHAETRILKEVSIFDKYTPKNDQQGRLPDGKKSYALSFVLRDDEKTLTDKQVDQVMQRLINAFENVGVEKDRKSTSLNSSP